MTDDDLTAYCVTPGCPNEATTGRLSAMHGDTPIVELICQECAGR